MGTRALITVFNEELTPILHLYRHWDGDQECCGLELKRFLCKGKLVQGFSPEGDENNFNGMGCMAAQLVANFKEEIGNFYIVTGEGGSCIDYKYSIYPSKDNKVMLKVTAGSEVIYEGVVEDYEIVEEMEE